MLPSAGHDTQRRDSVGPSRAVNGEALPNIASNSNGAAASINSSSNSSSSACTRGGAHRHERRAARRRIAAKRAQRRAQRIPRAPIHTPAGRGADPGRRRAPPTAPQARPRLRVWRAPRSRPTPLSGAGRPRALLLPAFGAAAASAYAPRHHTVLSTCQNQSLFAPPCFSLLLSVIILCRSFHAATSKPHSVNLRINSHDASTQRRPWVPRGARRQHRCVLHAVAPAAPAQRARKARPVLGGDADAATELCCGRRITPLRLSRAQASERRARRSQRYYRLVVALEQTDTSRVACECLAILVCAGPRSRRRVNGMVASRRQGGGRLNGGVASSGSLSLRRMKA